MKIRIAERSQTDSFDTRHPWSWHNG